MATRDGMTLAGTGTTLAQLYDVALLDLDGVVYIGEDAVAGAARALADARRLGMRLAFVTNNAARPPSVVAAHLTALGIPATGAEVINSAQAAAHYLAERLRPGAKVLLVGTTGLQEALTERGLTPVRSADDQPEAVVQGYSPDLMWAELAEAAIAIRRGVAWVATNADPTVPSSRGPLPGNGSTVAALRHATGATPTVTGKPEPTMHRESVERSGAQRPLVVGDRLDTDVEGANAAGCPSLLVLTGVTEPGDLLAAPARLRPTYLGWDLEALLQVHDAPVVHGTRADCGEWTATADGKAIILRRVRDERGTERAPVIAHSEADESLPAGSVLDALRALCAAAWSAADRGSEGAMTAAAIAGADAAAERALRTLRLTRRG